jgi:hypothetical protein
MEEDLAKECVEKFNALIHRLVGVLEQLGANCREKSVETLLTASAMTSLRGLLGTALLLNNKKILDLFIKSSTVPVEEGKNYWDLVLAKDEAAIPKCLTFFESGNALDYALHVAELLSNKTVATPTIMSGLWEILKGLCENSILFVHYDRGRRFSEEKGKFVYARSSYDSVKVSHYAKLFDIRV